MAETLPSKSAPTTEIGRPGMVLGGALPGIPAWGQFFDNREYAPDVQWPRSVEIYERMQSDAQLKGLLLATTLPIQRFRWEIDPNGAKPEVIDHIAASLNLPVRGQEPKPMRRRKRFSWNTHLRHALASLAFGHYYFEQVYEYRDPREGGDGLLHLRKLGTRPPHTIQNILVAEDGGLEGIVQNVHSSIPYGRSLSAGLMGEPLKVERLLAYIWDSRDDGDWVGTSMLRACFRDWLVKDRLVRVNATKHERNAMGIPWFEVDANAGQGQIDALAEVAEEMRAGVRTGGAGPGKLSIKGVEGLLPDTIGDVRYHDEQMAKAFILLFFDLGKSHSGSRALGGEFIDWYTHGQAGIADFIVDTAQTYQVEDEVELNWGPDEQPPMLAYTRLETAEASVEDLKQMIESGLIAVDEEVRSWIVQRYNLPPGAALAPEPPPGATEAPGEGEDTGEAPPAAETGTEGPVEVTEHTRSTPSAAGRPPTKRADLSARLEAAVRAPMLWTDAAAAIDANPKNGTARRARDELVEAGILTKRLDNERALVLAPVAGIKLPERELRRQPYDFEVAASVDFAALEETYTKQRDSLVTAVKAAQSAQIDQLVSEVEAAAGNAAKLAALKCDPVSAEMIEGHLMTTAKEGEASAKAEHDAQMAPSASAPRAAAADKEEVEETIAERAAAVAITLATGLAVAASKRAAAVSTLAPADAAADVRSYLGGLSDAELNRQLGGATTQALNTGRRAYMRANDPKTVYASELLDASTCAECTAIDGTEWETLEEAEESYPIGGFISCEAGLNCRGTLISSY